MIGPADIEAWSEDEAAAPATPTLERPHRSPHLFGLPMARAARAFALTRECAEMFDWRRNGFGGRT